MLTSRKPKNIKYHNQRLILALLRSREVMTAGGRQEARAVCPERRPSLCDFHNSRE